MISVEVAAQQLLDKLAEMNQRIEDFPPKMREEMTTWQHDDLNNTRPEPVDTPDTKSVATRVKVRRRRTRHQRVIERFARRIIRRLTPAPVRAIRRYAALGRRIQAGRLPLPRPIRQFRRLSRQARAISRGAPRAIRATAPRSIRRIFTMERQARNFVDLTDALATRMDNLARNNISWR